VLGHDVQLQLLHHPDQAGCLAGRQLEDEPGQGRGVDDQVLEGAAQPPAQEISVEGVVAVLDQDRPLGEAQEGGAGVAEVGGAHQHRAIDLVAAARVGVDGGPAVDQRVEEGQRPRKSEAFGADLQDQEGPVAGGLDVQRHILGRVQWGVRPGGFGGAGQPAEDRRVRAPWLEQDLPVPQ
jgi:hypothetical protein